MLIIKVPKCLLRILKWFMAKLASSIVLYTYATIQKSSVSSIKRRWSCLLYGLQSWFPMTLLIFIITRNTSGLLPIINLALVNYQFRDYQLFWHCSPNQAFVRCIYNRSLLVPRATKNKASCHLTENSPAEQIDQSSNGWYGFAAKTSFTNIPSLNLIGSPSSFITKTSLLAESSGHIGYMIVS